MTKDCVSLEIAKKLQGAGWPQDGDKVSTWAYWYGIKEDLKLSLSAHLSLGYGDTVAAPTIGELLEELPDGVSLWRGSGSKTWHAQTEDESLGVRLITTPADALATLWLALKEKNLV